MNLLTTFRNICRYNYQRLFKSPFYPVKILPSVLFKNIIDFDRLSEIGDFILVRVSERSLMDTFNRLGYLRSEAVDHTEVPNMSMSILGGILEIKHIKFFPRGQGRDAWNNRRVRFYHYLESYRVLSQYSPILLKLSDFHNVPIPFIAEGKDSIKRVKKHGGKNLGDGRYEALGKIRIDHVPTMLNYWHIELKIIDFEDKAIKNSRSELNNYVCSAIITDFIQETAQSSLDQSLPVIPPDRYMIA